MTASKKYLVRYSQGSEWTKIELSTLPRIGRDGDDIQDAVEVEPYEDIEEVLRAKNSELSEGETPYVEFPSEDEFVRSNHGFDQYYESRGEDDIPLPQDTGEVEVYESDFHGGDLVGRFDNEDDATAFVAIEPCYTDCQCGGRWVSIRGGEE